MNNAQSLLPRLLPATAAFGAAALLAWVVFDTFNAYRAIQEAFQDGEAILRSRTNSQTPASGINLAQIPNWHLFGDRSQQTKATIPQKIIEAPTTPLALTLQGTFRGKSNTEESWAIISSSDSEQAMYQVGDEIPGGATLLAVEPFRVILERNGRHESLSLPRPSMDEEQQAATGKEPHPSTGRRVPDAMPNRIPPPASPTADKYTEKQALIEEMARIRSKFAR